MASPGSERAFAPRLLHVLTVPDTLEFLRGQIEYVKERGFDVAAACSGEPSMEHVGKTLEYYRERAGIQVHSVSMHRRISPLHDVRTIAELVALMRRFRPHIVHSHTPKGGLLGMVAARAANVPVRIYHLRGLLMETSTGARRQLLANTERVACSLATTTICVSHSVRRTAIEERLVRPDRIRVLLQGSSNGVDARERFNPERVGDVRAEVRRSLGIGPDEPVVGFVGRLVRDKGIFELAEAWPRVREAVPNARLVIAGDYEEHDPVPESVREKVARDPSIQVLGFRADAPRLYTAFDVVALPTYREGFPNVALEAAAMCRPIVASRVTGCVDAVDDGVTGTLIPARDAAALARAIQRYLKDPELRERHGAAGRARVEQFFDQPRLWAAVAEVYDELLKASGALETRER